METLCPRHYLLRSMKFLAAHLTKRIQRDRTAATGEVLAKDAVDFGLVSAARCFGLLTEELDNVIVEHDGDARLSRRCNDRATLALRKIVLVTHDSAPFHPGWPF